MRRSGLGCRPGQRGRTEQLHLGRGPGVVRPPGDRPGKKDKGDQSGGQSQNQAPWLVGALPAPPLLLSEDGHVFSRFPSRVQEEFTAHTMVQTALFSMVQTLKYSKPRR